MLELKDITKVYKSGEEQVNALNGISLTFGESGFVSILGQSGCGKTTLLNIIGGLDRATDGDIFINNQSTKSYKDKDWDAYRNNSIGFIFQSYNLIPHLTVLQNVELAMTLSGVSPSLRKKKAIQMLEKVGLGSQINKKPNQLSGGQMQRVAIARALINNPEIILADEPTGALDSKSSVQIMDIIKEISNDKLVIMVTHNATLANEYSTRIIRMADGKILEDTIGAVPAKEECSIDSRSSNEEDVNNIDSGKSEKKNKTSMSFFTAATLSFKNLLTKKGRTFLTSFAGSIGIIGIALVLALSTGVDNYIKSTENEFLGATPVAVNSIDMDISSFMTSDSYSYSYNQEKEFPTDEIIKKNTIQSQMGDVDFTKIEKYNDISDDFVNYVKENLDKKYYNSIDELRTITFNFLMTKNDEYYINTSNLSQMVSNENFVKNNYEVLKGEFSFDKYSLNVVVDANNYLSEMAYSLLGLDEDEVEFDNVIGKEFYIADNDDAYTEVKLSNKNYYRLNVGDELLPVSSENNSKTIKVKISSIIRVKNNSNASPFLMSGIYFNKSLGDEILQNAKDSQIVVDQLKNTTKSVLDNKTIASGGMLSTLMGGISSYMETSKYTLASINADESIKTLNIYPIDYQSREPIIDVINAYNEQENIEDAQKISVTDSAALMFDALGEMTDIVTYALTGFLAVSLLVSTVMIAVITYISVIERTREIGILRSIGARKKDISRVFNSETFIIGLFSGSLGVILSYILIIPINLILNSLVNIPNLCILTPWASIILIAVSVVLTLISGFIPSKIAARKDPIKALRTE